jgi:hypothetical protein
MLARSLLYRRLIVSVGWLFFPGSTFLGAQDTASGLVDRLERAFELPSRLEARLTVASFKRPFNPAGGASSKEIPIMNGNSLVRRDKERWMIELRNVRRSRADAQPSVQAVNLVFPDATNSSRIYVQNDYLDTGAANADRSGDASWIVTARRDPNLGPKLPAPLYLEEAGIVFGYMAADATLPLVQILRDSELSLEGDEPVGDRRCKVLTSVGRFGTRRLWLDPARDYHVLKITITRMGDDYIGERRVASFDGSRNNGISLPKLPLERIVTILDNVSLKKVGGGS